MRVIPVVMLSAMLLIGGVGTARAQDNEAASSLLQRLTVLQVNPATAELALLEKLQAQQAIELLAKSKKKDREQLLFLASRRVEIAETAARAAAARQEVGQLDKARAELLIEASRREAARVRAELEKVRMQAQLQAEEADRLRQEAEAEMLARQDAEQALFTASGNQAARLSEAQQKAAKLAREEAELVSGHRLPSSRFETRGEVFSLSGDAFAAGAARLSTTASQQLKALAEYAAIVGKRGRIRIEGYDSANGVGEQRARAVHDALVSSGVAGSRLQVSGKKAASTRARSVEIVIAP